VLWICLAFNADPDPGLFPPVRIRIQGAKQIRIRIEILVSDVHPGFGFFSISDPVVKKAPVPDPQHRWAITVI
jgi:hypothetical protein